MDVHVAEEKKDLAVLKREPLSFLPHNLDEMWRIAEMVSKSMLAPPALQGKPFDCQLVLMTGWELGLTTTQALRDIDVVKGKTYMRALLKVALVKQSPECKYFRMVESTEKRAVFETDRKNEGVTRFEFTVEDAERARVLNRVGRDGKPLEDDNWTKWLRLMLRRRCASQLADEVYPDVVRGIRDREDLEEEREAAGVVATVTRIGTAPPPPEDKPADPVPTPPKAEKVRRIPIVDVPAPAEVKAATDTITSSDMDRAGPPPVMSEFDIICAKLDECQTKQQVDDLSIAHVNYQGPGRDDLRKLFKAKRAELEKGGK
jgi:hypothetical protein